MPGAAGRACRTHPNTPNHEAPVNTRVKMLKVKIKSLADEARIIRLEERRAGGRVTVVNKRVIGRNDRLRAELRGHRTGVVRSEQRHSLLAYGFLRGRHRWEIERPYKCRMDNPDWERVRKLVFKFGTTSNLSLAHNEQNRLFEQWRTAVAPVPAPVG